MTLPSDVSIGSHKYKVLFPYRFTERGDCNGQEDSGTKVLKISDVDTYGFPRPDTAILVTFLHEILHACDFTSGARVFSDNERALEGISEMLAQALISIGWVK